MTDFEVGDRVRVLTHDGATFEGVLMSIECYGGIDVIRITPGIMFPLSDIILTR